MKDVIKTLVIVSFMAFIACGVMAFLHDGTLWQVLWQACLMVAVYSSPHTRSVTGENPRKTHCFAII